jgi:hypothetical protein
MGSLLAVPSLARGAEDWIPLFDGRSLTGWKASENPDSFKVRDGQIAADGPRAHLFYSGPVRDADFKNFELKLDVLTRPGANAGVYFHTRFQPKGWPAQGFEVQINNTYRGEGDYRERKKTGSLYGVRNVYKTMARDDEWFQVQIAVRGPQVQIRVNETLLVDYVEADPPVSVDPGFSRVLERGAFALQCHDPGSKVFFRNVLLRPLPDDLPATPPRPAADAIYRELMRLGNQNYPLVDSHVHLRPGMQLEDLLRQSRRDGIQYGIAVNGGLRQMVTDDAGAEAFLKRLEGQPVFAAFQAEGREWVKMFSKRTLEKFDYLFTDSMTFTDDDGRRMRLWIPSEVGEIKDPERFMEVFVSRTLGVLNQEPIDIYVNPTFLPDAIGAQYERLWTPERRAKVIEALRRNDVALEINNRYRLPSPVFIKEAKQAGVKFTFGSNNGGTRDLGRLEYGLEMVKECGLTWQDFWVPRPEGAKAIQRRGLA